MSGDADAPQPRGRAALIEAAADLIAETRLEDVLGFLGPRAVARRSQVAVGTVTYHFPTRGSNLGEAALTRAVNRVGDDPLDALYERMNAVGFDEGTSEETAVDDFLAALASNLVTNSPAKPGSDPRVESRESAFYLAAAVAPRDSRARRAMSENLESNRLVREEISESMLHHRRRRWRAGITKETLAVAQEALVYGFLLIRRFDPARGDPKVYAAMAMRLFDACSLPDSVPDTPDYRDSLLVPPRLRHLDVTMRDAIVEAATHIYRDSGWSGLNPIAVAEQAGLSRPTVVANFKDRDSLAAAVWARFLPELEQAAQRDLRLPLHAAVRTSLERVASIARRDPALTAAFLGAVLSHAAEHGPAAPDDLADPRNFAPVHHLLEPAISKYSHHFRSGHAGSEEDVTAIAYSLVQQALSLAVTQPNLGSLEIADLVCTSTLAGLLRRRPGV